MATVQAVLVDLGGVPGSTAAVTTVHAEQAPPPGKGVEFGEASPVGLIVILLLAVATIILIRSMSKRIRRLPASFDAPEDRLEDDGATGSGEPAGTQPTRDVEDAGGGRS